MSVNINFLMAPVCLSLLLAGCTTSAPQIRKPILAPESTEKWSVYIDTNYRSFTKKFFSSSRYDGKCATHFKILPKQAITESLKGLYVYDSHYISENPFDFDCIGAYYSLNQIDLAAGEGDAFSKGYMFLYRFFEHEDQVCSKVAGYGELDVGNPSAKLADDIYFIFGVVAERCGDEPSAVRWYNLAVNEGSRDAYYAINALWIRQAEQRQAERLRGL